MTTLRVVLDQVIAPGAGEPTRYALQLARELVASAPQDVVIEGLIASSREAEYARVRALVPGLAGLRKSAFDAGARRSLWRRGLALPRGGMTHAPDLLAPMGRRDRTEPIGVQTVVTVHDTLAWTAPERLPKGEAAWRRGMLARAERYADAVVVPNHAVADSLARIGGFGDRVRVIPAGASSDLTVPADAGARAVALGLPERYLLAWSDGASHRALLPLLRSLDRTDGPTAPLVILGPAEVADVVSESRLDPSRVTILDPVESADRATVLGRAAVLVHPGPAEGFGLQLIDAMRAGVPVVHPDDPSLEELTAGAALVVSRSDIAGYTASLGQHLDALLDDRQTLDRLSVAGRDRAGLFTWRDSAEKIWQLHADL